jgi:hypothetical protein
VIVHCTRCPAQYDDTSQWTFCPHALRVPVALPPLLVVDTGHLSVDAMLDLMRPHAVVRLEPDEIRERFEFFTRMTGIPAEPTKGNP